MKKIIINILNPIRAVIMRRIKPNSKYFLATRSLKPLSNKFGYDRGKPIDRYYIEKFLRENKKYIKGRCLEIVDNSYSLKFGGKKVTKSDVLDNNPKNSDANIHGDLRNLSMIENNKYDCIILTQVLGLIDDYEAAIKECKRILKPSGVILLTSACFSPTLDINQNFWRFTSASIKYIFGKFFNRNKLFVKSYGNVLAGQCFWVGLAQEELSKKELEYNDPRYPCIVAARIIK